MTVKAIDHVQLAMPAGGEEEAIAFYQGLLGIPNVPKPKHLAGRGGCWFEDIDDRGRGVRVHLGVDPEFRPARKAHPALEVEGLADLIRRLKDAGAEVTSGEGADGAIGRIQFYVDDPFGNRIELLGGASSG
jgi:catechol 2,3-dioxygenase-like lactoylglutathione lyase family enzyme